MALSLETDRLVLREWRDDDRAEFARMNADPRVMEFMAHRLTPEESDALIDRIRECFAQRGFGFWAVEVKQTTPIIGFVGLSVPRFQAPFTPCVEIGWRLAAEHWGHGYATEAAERVLQHAFSDVGLLDVVSFTTKSNHRSRRVMERLGMHRSLEEDFDHPSLPATHPLRRHVLYRLKSTEWIALQDRQVETRAQ